MIFLKHPTLEAQKYSLPEDRHPWTMGHGYYALMGGLAIRIPRNLPESRKFLPSDQDETRFITRHGVHLLLWELENGRDELPNLSAEEIRSKSKANGLAKALVCFQALWFIAACLTRRRS